MVILTSFPPPEEGIRHKQENTTANIDGSAKGNGTLYVAESRLSWMGENGQGFSLEYPAISLHAVSRDTTSFPDECLYLMIDGKISDLDNQGSSDDDEDSPPIGEIRFVPSDKGALDAMFLSMNECQALHPDPQDTDSSAEEAEAEFYTGEDGEGELTPGGRATLQNMENMLQVGQGDGSDPQVNGNHPEPDENRELGQFEDADMEHQ